MYGSGPGKVAVHAGLVEMESLGPGGYALHP